jgi:hypothetical protein
MSRSTVYKFATQLKLDFVQDKNGKPKRLAVRLTELQQQTFNIAGGAIPQDG